MEGRAAAAAAAAASASSLAASLSAAARAAISVADFFPPAVAELGRLVADLGRPAAEVGRLNVFLPGAPEPDAPEIDLFFNGLGTGSFPVPPRDLGRTGVFFDGGFVAIALMAIVSASAAICFFVLTIFFFVFVLTVAAAVGAEAGAEERAVDVSAVLCALSALILSTLALATFAL